MTSEKWTAVDEYVAGLIVPSDEVLEAALRASAEGGLPSMQVSAAQGKFLNLLARAMERGGYWKSGRWVVIAPFGWRVLCRKTAG